MFKKAISTTAAVLLFSAVSCSLFGAQEKIKARIKAEALRVKVGEQVKFDGRASTPGNSKEFHALYWDFNDMDQVDVDAIGDTVSNSFNHTGSYTVRLTVENHIGERDQAEVSVEVLPDIDTGPSITDYFEGGKTGVILNTDETFAFRLEWGNQFYFRVDNAKGSRISLRIYGYGPKRLIPLSVSPYQDDYAFNDSFQVMVNTDYQNPDWKVLAGAEHIYNPEDESLLIRFTPQAESVYLAWSIPYTLRNLNAFIERWEDHPDFYLSPIGLSVEGRPLYHITISDSEVPDDKKKVIWITGTQHGYEMAAGPVCEGIAEALLAQGDSAAELRRKYVYQLVPLVNPDAVARGGYRYNMHDVDLNRNWDNLKLKPWDNEISEPEVAAVKRILDEWVADGGGLDMFFDFHCLTALSGSLLMIMAGQDSIPPEIAREEERFMNDFFSRSYVWRLSKNKSTADACGMVSDYYAESTGVLSFTSEHCIGWVTKKGQPKQRSTPAFWRELGRDYVKTIRDYFDSTTE
jgi:Zinc carboxypeptidase/PKD domain